MMSEDIDRVLGDTNYNLGPVLREIGDKRRSPRVDVRTDVVVTTQDGETLNTRMRNLSAEGMQIRCDPATARKLSPPTARSAPDRGANITLRFSLDTPAGRSAFEAAAQVRYATVKNPNAVAFGLKFTGLSLDVKKRLSDYLIDCMRPVNG